MIVHNKIVKCLETYGMDVLLYTVYSRQIKSDVTECMCVLVCAREKTVCMCVIDVHENVCTDTSTYICVCVSLCPLLCPCVPSGFSQ